MSIEKMIHYLTEAIDYKTADDIYLLPRAEFTKYVAKCSSIENRFIPYAVLVLLHEEKNSTWYKVKSFLKNMVTKDA